MNLRSVNLLLILMVLLFSLSCTMSDFKPAFPGPLSFPEKSKPIIISSPEEFFLQADQLFRDGRYSRSMRQVRRIYQEAIDPNVEEEALFRIFLILAYGENPNRDYEEARKVGSAFLKAYPESKRKQEVAAVLLLLKEIHRGGAEIETLKGYNTIQEEKNLRLEEDLRKIKEIDLQLEEQKKKLE